MVVALSVLGVIAMMAVPMLNLPVRAWSEAAVRRDLAQVSGVMEKCRALGIRFALDDFGTGYSSLNYLKHLLADNIALTR